MRVPVDPAAPVRVDIMGRGFLDVLHARDICVGGLGISVPHGFEGCDIDSEVELIVTLGRAPPFKTTGAIRHHGKPGDGHVFGVEFVALSPEQHRAVEAYVEACSRARSTRATLGAPLLTRT